MDNQETDRRFEHGDTMSQAPTSEANAYFPYSAYDITCAMRKTALDCFSERRINEIVANPMQNNAELRQLSEVVYNLNGIVRNTIDYMAAMPTLDRVVIPYGESPRKMAKAKQLITEALRILRDKQMVRSIIHAVLVDGTYFAYIDTKHSPLWGKFVRQWDIDNNMEVNQVQSIKGLINLGFVVLPLDYSKIICYRNNSPVIALNLEYFSDGINGENRLKSFPKEIRDVYHSWIKKGSKQDGQWYVLDNTKTIAVKISSKHEEPWGRPLALCALSDVLYADQYIKTKRHILDNLNYDIYYQTFPEGKEKGVSALTGKQQENQHNMVRDGIVNNNRGIKRSFFSVAAGTKIDKLPEPSTDALDEKNEANNNNNISISLGFSGSLLSANGTSTYAAQENNLMLVASQIFSIVEDITYEFNKVLKHAILGNDEKNYAEVYYLPITYTNETKKFNEMKDLYITAKGSVQLLVASTGIRPDAFFALLDMEKDEIGWDTKYRPHATSYNSGDVEGSNSAKAGRPTIDDPTNPSTIKTRANNANEQPKPSTAD